jgi:hypothetical protein
VLTVPVEALFRRDDVEIVYVRKPKPATPVASPSLVARAFAAEPSPSPTPKLEEKDKWREQFEVREVSTGLASYERIEVLKGLATGDEIAVEDPTKPKEKKDRE